MILVIALGHIIMTANPTTTTGRAYHLINNELAAATAKLATKAI